MATGTLNLIEFDDTSTIVAEEILTGTIVEVEANDIPSITSTEIFAGTLDVTEDDDVHTINGNVSLIDYIGTLDVTESDDSIITAGEMIYDFRGTLDVTELDDVPAINTEAEYTGTLSEAESNDSPTINGGMSIHAHTGTLNVIESDDSVIITSEEIFAGTLDVTEANDTLIGQSANIGTLDVSESDDSITSNGIEIFAGTLNLTEVNDTTTTDSDSEYIGVLDVTELGDEPTINGTTILNATGTLNVSENDDTSIIVGVYPVDGTVVVVERDDFTITDGTVVVLPSKGKTANQITRPLVAKTIEKFYVSFYGMTENISNILGSEVMSLERPNLTFNDMDIYNKGKRFSNNALIHYQPLTITFYDDDQSLVNYALINQVKKQTFKVEGDDYFEIHTKIYSPNGSIPEEFTLKHCHIQNITYSESNV